MNKIIPVTLAALTFASLFAAPANAQWGMGSFRNINATEAQLQARIDSGRRSGMLTVSEVNDLQRKLSRIDNLEGRLRATGGRLNFGERARVNSELASLNSQITAQLNDSQTRWNGRGHHHSDRDRYTSGRPGWNH